ncbi:MAG TPA: hypothetical protein VFT95_08665 [Micromonosporaceae bacterium]|nr:hypothetical protein [Micromonosporaceae bacterium]
MATSTRRYNPIKGRILRVIQLNECGVPVTGTSGGVVTVTGFTQVQSSAQYEDGEEYIVKTADAALCVNERDASILKRFEITTTLCSIDPGLVAKTVSPARLLTASESPTGTGFAVAEGLSTAHFSLEVWQRVAGSGACDASGTQRYVYNAWPHLYDAKIGDYSIANEPSSLEFTAQSKAVSTLWTAGNPWLGSGAVSVVQDHWFQNLTTTAPPTEVTGINDYVAP